MDNTEKCVHSNVDRNNAMIMKEAQADAMYNAIIE